MVQRWLLFMLNIFVAFLAALTVTLVTQVRDHGADFAGPGLVTLLQLGQIMATTVRSYAKLETSMGAVQRLKAISENTPSEASEGDNVVPPISWPSSGRIRLDGVSASYTYVNRPWPALFFAPDTCSAGRGRYSVRTWMLTRFHVE